MHDRLSTAKVGMIFFRTLALACTLTVCVHSYAQSPCSIAEVQSRLESAGLHVLEALDIDAGGVVVVLALQGRPGLVMWISYKDDGTLWTRQRAIAPDPDKARLAFEMADIAIGAFEGAQELADCPMLRGISEEAAAKVIDLVTNEARKRSDGPLIRSSPSSLPSDPLVFACHVLAALLGIAWLALTIIACIRGAVRNPRDAMLFCGVFLLALLVRIFSSERLPTGASHGDLTHFADMALSVEGGFSEFFTAYPPAWRALVFIVTRVTGNTLDVAFVLTTIAGAAIAVASSVFIRDITTKIAAGMLAGLAVTTWPPAIYFSNGMNLEIPGALFMTVSFMHLQATARTGSKMDAMLWALSLSLFAQSRVEAVPLAPVILGVQAAMVWAEGGFKNIAKNLPVLIIVTASFVPYAILIWQVLITQEKSRQVDAPLSIAFALITILAAFIVKVLSDHVETRGRRPLFFVTCTLALSTGIYLLANAKGNPFFAEPFTDPAKKHLSLWVVGEWTWWDQCRVAPFWLVAIAFMALAPGSRRPAIPPVAPGLILLPLLGHLITRHFATGILPMEGLRHHAMWVGLVGSAIGLGAFRFYEFFKKKFILVIEAVALLLPLWTHKAYFTDTRYNTQQEFLFLREGIQKIADGAVVLYPDDLASGPDGIREISDYTRTRDLVLGLAFAEGRDFKVMGAIRYLKDPIPPPGPVFFVALTECMSGLETCIEARHFGVSITEKSVKNRLYSAMTSTLIASFDEVKMAIYELPEKAFEALRQRLLRSDLSLIKVE